MRRISLPSYHPGRGQPAGRTGAETSVAVTERWYPAYPNLSVNIRFIRRVRPPQCTAVPLVRLDQARHCHVNGKELKRR